ncbi:MAG: metallophosphoesterase [Bacilli bacterium]|nr:metallophosphoesterase [Bacilli bacterium]
MKLFVVSDIHGFYSEFIRDIHNAGFNEEDDNHLLIVLGDLFDRGEESKSIYTYLKDLTDKKRAVVLHGNHEDFLIDFLEGKDCFFNYNYNGFNSTLDSFLLQTRSFEMFCFYCSSEPDMAEEMYGDDIKTITLDSSAVPTEIKFELFQEYARRTILKRNKDLLGWLKSLPFYFETKNYIFTHASIDGTCEDWHNPIKSGYAGQTPWQYLTWDDGYFYRQPVTNTDKTVVVGHFHTDAIRSKNGLPFPDEEDNTILYGDKKIFIDTCTVLTHRVNVLVLEDELI